MGGHINNTKPLKFKSVANQGFYVLGHKSHCCMQETVSELHNSFRVGKKNKYHKTLFAFHLVHKAFLLLLILYPTITCERRGLGEKAGGRGAYPCL